MRYVIDRIRNIEPYKASEICEGEIKLDAQENPYELPSDVKTAIVKELSALRLNRYPDPECSGLREAIAGYCGVKASNIMVGNGSDELIQLVLFACGGPSRTAAAPEPTFAMYRLLSELTGTAYTAVPHEEGFALPVSRLLSLSPEIIFITYPNNPTGNCYPVAEIKRTIEEARGVVVVDEAYFEFSKKTIVRELEKYENLIILRTFSKAFSLAGIRSGYLIAGEGLTEHLRKAQLPYSFSMLNQKILEVVLSQSEKVLSSVDKILDSRKKMFAEISRMSGITPFVSEANFILMKFNSVERVLTALKRNNIKVREFSDPGLRDYLRVTVGTEKENRDFLESIREAEIENS